MCVSSTFLLPLTPLTIASYSPASHLGSVSMALSSTGSSHTYHLAPSVSDVMTLSRPSTPPPVAPPRLCSRSTAFYHAHYPLSNLISSLSLNHHLCADDTQLFFSFYPANCDSSITHLQNALHQISLNTTHSARNPGFIFDEHLTFSDQISTISPPLGIGR